MREGEVARVRPPPRRERVVAADVRERHGGHGKALLHDPRKDLIDGVHALPGVRVLCVPEGLFFLWIVPAPRRLVLAVRACRWRVEEHDARDPGPLDGLRDFGRVGLGLGVEGRRRRRVDDRAVASEAVQQGR